VNVGALTATKATQLSVAARHICLRCCRLLSLKTSGVILYFTADSSQAKFFYKAPARINGLAEVGHLLLASQFIFGDDYTTNVLRASGFLLNTDRWSLANLNESAWNSTEEYIYIHELYSGLERRSINLETGEIGNNTYGTHYLNPGVYVESPFVFSPDDSLIVSADGKSYYSDEIQAFEDQTISPDGFSDLLWTANEGLVTTRASGIDTVVEHRTADLATNDSRILSSRPLELLHNDGTFYIITGSPVTGILINAYNPSETGATTLTTVAPQPVVNESDAEDQDVNADGIVDNTDLEYIDFKNSVQGNWETECSVVNGSNGSLYSIHGLVVSESEIRSGLAFYTDSGCQSYLSGALINASALHRSIISYSGIVESTIGLPVMELTFVTTDELNSPPFPIHFARNQIYSVAGSRLYFGTIGLSNVESLKLDFDVPYYKVESFHNESLFESINQSVISGYNNSFDTDRDGVKNRDDEFPLDPNEFRDSDNDGIGDNADTDDDNDGIVDLEDSNPFTP